MRSSTLSTLLRGDPARHQLGGSGTCANNTAGIGGQPVDLVWAEFAETQDVTLKLQAGSASVQFTVLYFVENARYTKTYSARAGGIVDSLRLTCSAIYVSAAYVGANWAFLASAPNTTATAAVTVGNVDPLAELQAQWIGLGSLVSQQGDTPVSGAGWLLGLSGYVSNMGGNAALYLFPFDAATLGVQTVAVTNPGADAFDGVPAVTFNGGGSGAGFVAATGHAVCGVFVMNITNGGSGYGAPPAVTIDPPPAGTQATAHAVLTGGVVTGIVIDNPGGGYTADPNVTIANTGTTQATATCRLGVRSVVVDTPGQGYTSTPTVQVAGGPDYNFTVAMTAQVPVAPPVMLSGPGQFGYVDETRAASPYTAGLSWGLSTSPNAYVPAAGAQATVAFKVGT